MQPGDVLYGLETAFGSGTSDSLQLLQKVPDPEGAGSALRAEFEDEEFDEELAKPEGRVVMHRESPRIGEQVLGLGPSRAPPRLRATYGGTIRTTFFPFEHADALLENVLWNPFGRASRAAENGNMRKSLVIKTVVENDLHQVFKGTMLSGMSLEVVRAGDDYQVQCVVDVTAKEYVVGDEARESIGNEEEALAGGADTNNRHILQNLRFTRKDGPEQIIATGVHAFSAYIRPGLRTLAGLGSIAPQDFELGDGPFECGGVVRYDIDGQSDSLLEQMIGQDCYDFEFEVVDITSTRARPGRGYRFSYPNVVFRQGWVTPPPDNTSKSYLSVEWLATQPEDRPAVKVTKLG